MTSGSQATVLVTASIFAAALSVPQGAGAETVIVKYRGEVDLKPFKCESVYQSSVVKRLCYDAKEGYVVVSLNGTYYHYCEVPAHVVSAWRASSSTGDYFNRNEGTLRLPNQPSSGIPLSIVEAQLTIGLPG